MYCSVLNNILDEIIVPIDQRFKPMGEFRFVDLLNPKPFQAHQNSFPVEAFPTLDVYNMKCELKSVYAAKKASRIQEVTEIIRELELKQAQREVTKLQDLFRP